MLWASAYFRDDAFDWFNTYLRNYMKNVMTFQNMKNRIKKIFLSWKNFKQILQQMFENIDETRTTKWNFQKLRQSKSTSNYVAKFQQHAVKIKWSDEALIAHHYIEFKKKVKNAIVLKERLTKLQNMIKKSIEIDNRQFERNLKKKNEYHNSMYKKKHHNERKIYSIQIKLNAISKSHQRQTKRSRIDKKEKFENKFQITCYECDKKEHYKRDYILDQLNTTQKQTVEKFKQIHAIFEQSKTEWNLIVVITKSFAEVLAVIENQEHQILHWTTCYENNCMTHYSSKINANYWSQRKQKKNKKALKDDRHNDQFSEKNQ